MKKSGFGEFLNHATRWVNHTNAKEFVRSFSTDPRRLQINQAACIRAKTGSVRSSPASGSANVPGQSRAAGLPNQECRERLVLRATPRCLCRDDFKHLTAAEFVTSGSDSAGHVWRTCPFGCRRSTGACHACADARAPQLLQGVVSAGMGVRTRTWTGFMSQVPGSSGIRSG